MNGPRRAVRTFGVDFRAGRRFDLGHRGRMIAVCMGDENMADGLVAHGIEEGRDMGVVVRAGIEDRDRAAPDNVTHRTFERERARIIGDHRAHARRHGFHGVGFEIEGLVEGDVVAHAGPYRAWAGR